MTSQSASHHGKSNSTNILLFVPKPSLWTECSLCRGRGGWNRAWWCFFRYPDETEQVTLCAVPNSLRKKKPMLMSCCRHLILNPRCHLMTDLVPHKNVFVITYNTKAGRKLRIIQLHVKTCLCSTNSTFHALR